jgi:hypothetical protein
MSKRKWKVYTTEELKDRFQPKPGASVITSEDDPQKVVVPNLKRRNSAPPGMIHFPPGTFSAGNSPNPLSHSPHNNRTQSPQPQHHSPNTSIARRADQHELITHAPRERGRISPSPSTKSGPNSYPYGARRRASLPYIPPDHSANPHPFHAHTTPGEGGSSSVPAIEAYLSHLQSIPLPQQDLDMYDEDIPSPPPSTSPSSSANHPKGVAERGLTHSPSQPPLPSFQSLLQTIREDADEEDSEIKEIEERAMQGSKSLPTFNISQNSHQNYTMTTIAPQSESPSSKFYKNNVSKSNENLPSLSRMSISDIIG